MTPDDGAPSGRRSGWGRRAVGAILVLGAFAFLGRTVARDWSRLRAYEWHVDPLLLPLSVLALVAVFCFGVYAWLRALRCLAPSTLRYRDILRIWFLSNLARYIPGKIWQFVGAAQMARDRGVPGAVVVTSLVVNMGFTLLSSLLVGLAMLPTGAVLAHVGLSGVPAWGGLVVLPVAVLAVHPAVLNGLLRLVPRWLHRDVLVWRGGWTDGLLLLGMGIVSWLGYGAALWLFVRSLLPPPAGALFALTGANALAFLAGYLVFIAPAGLGARELSMTALLTPLFPGSVAAVVALGSRLWIVAAELVGAAAVVLATRGARRSP